MEELIILKEPNSIKEPKQIFKHIQEINIDYEQENLILIVLNTPNEIISNEIVFKGGLNSCIIDFRTLLRKVLLKNGNAFIIAHNHPSGNLNPSGEDIKIYEKLKEVSKILTIAVLDSIIFNKTHFYSLNNERKPFEVV